MNARAIALLRAPVTRALVGGFFMALGGPPFPGWLAALSWFGVALLASAVEGPARLRSAFARGWWFGFVTNFIVFLFVPATVVRFTEIPRVAAFGLLALLAGAQALAWGAAGLATALGTRGGLPLAIAFPIGVAIAMMAPALFPWTIATPLARAPTFLQAAEVIGERGVAIMVAVSGALAAHAWSLRESDGVLSGAGEIRRRARLVERSRGDTPGAASWHGAFPAFAIPLVLLAYGLLRRPAVEARLAFAPRRTIALVQQAIPPQDRWKPELHSTILSRLWSLTRIAEANGAELVIWPEAAYPYVLPHEGGLDVGPDRIRGPGIHGEILTGLLTEAARDDSDDVRAAWRYNAAVLVHGDGRIAAPAAKLELLAFGESVPFGDRFPVLRRTFARAGGLKAGRSVVILSTALGPPEVRAGVLNCYEDTLPHIARRVAAADPNLIVNLTNDAWFGATAEPELHLLAAIPRAIEARRDMVRAVNTGVTAHVDAFGRVVARAERETPTVLLVRPALIEGKPTPYVRWGDVMWAVPLFAAALAALVARPRA